MYADIPVSLAVVLVVSGLALLAWSSDRFVAGSAALAKNLGVSQFVIGMVVIGFGTSAPELLVSAFSGASGHSNLSLGNAYGSCFFNIAGILGVAALVKPIVVKKSIPRFGVPVLLAISAVSYILIRDGSLSRIDAAILLVIFAITMPLYCFIDRKGGDAAQDGEEIKEMSFAASLAWSLAGLVVMIGASHLLVWGSVDLARSLGVSELMIGLTVVAIGTSLPELASALAASRRGESELVLGNIIGSNIFNMLAVVGIAGAISPIEKFSPCVLGRDLPVLAAGVDTKDQAAIAAFASSLPGGFAGYRVEDGRVKWLVDGAEPGEAIRTPEINANASLVAATPEVRASITALLRSLSSLGDIIVEGRDITTAVFPDTPARFYLTASAEVRAARRRKEQVEKGISSESAEAVKASLLARDKIDSTRKCAPLAKADGVLEIDSSDMSFEAVVEAVLSALPEGWAS